MSNSVSVRSIGIPQAGLLAHVVDGGHGGGDGVVLKALGLADDEDVLEVDLLGMRCRG